MPTWSLYLAAVLLGSGLWGLGLAVLPRPPRGLSPAQRISDFAAASRQVETFGAGDTLGHPVAGGAAPPSPAGATGSARESARDTATDVATDLLRHHKGLEVRIASRLDESGSELKPAEWLVLHAAALVTTTVLGLLIGAGDPLIAIGFAVIGLISPWIFLGVRRSRRRSAFHRALPDTLHLLSSSLSAGLSLQQSLDIVVRDGAEPIASEFRRILVETRLGVSIEDAMENVAHRYASQDFAWMVMAIRIQRQVGGNLAELLSTVAATMREREYLRRQVSALSAEGRLSALVLALLPPLFLAYLSLTNWDYVRPLFTDLRGLLMLGGGGLLLGVGVMWMSRLVKVQV